MDALAALLDGPRARSAFLLRSALDPPWSLRIEDAAPLTVMAVVRGEAHVWGDDDASEETVVVRAGDVAIFRGPAPYTVADDRATAPQVRIGPDQACEALAPAGRSLLDSLPTGVRTWGNTAPARDAAATVLLTGTYPLAGAVSASLLRALPPRVVLRAGEWSCPVIGLLAEEIGRDAPGQEAVLDRLLDLLLVAALRAWFARPQADAPAWYAASADPVVGHALALVHHNPQHPWTLASLARECAVSRAALARRFAELVGEPPMTYLTGWRLALAADLLLEPGTTLASVAERVGYGGPFALSTAFKRVRGVSPAEHRALAAA